MSILAQLSADLQIFTAVFLKLFSSKNHFVAFYFGLKHFFEFLWRIVIKYGALHHFAKFLRKNTISLKKFPPVLSIVEQPLI